MFRGDRIFNTGVYGTAREIFDLIAHRSLAAIPPEKINCKSIDRIVFNGILAYQPNIFAADREHVEIAINPLIDRFALLIEKSINLKLYQTCDDATKQRIKETLADSLIEAASHYSTPSTICPWMSVGCTGMGIQAEILLHTQKSMLGFGKEKSIAELSVLFPTDLFGKITYRLFQNSRHKYRVFYTMPSLVGEKLKPTFDRINQFIENTIKSNVHVRKFDAVADDSQSRFSKLPRDVRGLIRQTLLPPPLDVKKNKESTEGKESEPTAADAAAIDTKKTSSEPHKPK